MELLYNPDARSEEEIKATFVARQPLVDKLIAMIERQPDGAGVQHVVIIAPRGMGKTTVLLMVKFTLKDRGLTGRWQAVKFPEESYGIYDLADFWIQTLELLAVETNDDAPRVQAEELKRKYPNNDDLQEATLAAIKDWRRKHKKRLLLLVENFDMILEQINDEQDNARLRDTLMNDGTMMLLGGATTFFKEARAYDQPLYNFFQIENLNDLRFEQMQELLRSRAALDALPNFDATLKANAGRLRVLEYFTGGNPRLVLMLYRVVTQSDLSEVRRGLETLLDQVTPYYKAKIEALPPQQRKILDHIARISGKTNEGLTPSEIAEAVRLSPNQTSSQLKRLSELGYVRAANMRGRSVPYTLAEPLYAIWHQMRFGRDAREKMRWLVNFLKAWYEQAAIESDGEKLTEEVLNKLQTSGFISKKEAQQFALPKKEKNTPTTNRNQKLAEILGKAANAYFAGKIEEALAHWGEALEIKPDDHNSWNNCGIALAHIGKHKEAVASYDKALKIKPNLHEAWYNRGIALEALDRREEAIASYHQALKISPNDPEYWFNLGNTLGNLGRYQEAISSFDRAIEIKSDYSPAWNNLTAASLEIVNSAAKQEDFAKVRHLWSEVSRSIPRSVDNDWHAVKTAVLLSIAGMGHLQFVRDLIRESNLEEQHFPIVRAIDYLQTGDESLIERLSPEVKGIVEEVVAKLRPVAKNTKSPKTKTKRV